MAECDGEKGNGMMCLGSENASWHQEPVSIAFTCSVEGMRSPKPRGGRALTGSFIETAETKERP